VVAIDLPNPRRLAYGVVLGQAVVTGIAVLVSLAVAGPHAAGSALLGGGISTLASLGMAIVGFSQGSADAQRAVMAFFAGEAVKLTVMIVLFVVVLKTMQVLPVPLFAAFMATFLVYWIVLAGSLRNT
jgi:F0F1-type ATP synthase assembly protein I